MNAPAPTPPNAHNPEGVVSRRSSWILVPFCSSWTRVPFCSSWRFWCLDEGGGPIRAQDEDEGVDLERAS